MRIITTAIFVLTPALLAQNPTVAGASGGGIVATAGVLGGQTFQVIAGQLVGGGTVTGAPYSGVATTQSTQTLADGSHIVHNSSANVYRDSQGRERREDSLPSLGGTSAAGPQMVMISDPVAGANYMLDANSHTAHRMPLPQQFQGAPQKSGGSDAFFISGMSVSGGMLPSSAGGKPIMIYRTQASGANLPAPQIEQLGSSTMEGVLAEGTRSTVTIPVGQAGNDRELQIVDERWYSSDLKVTVLSRHSDPRMGETVYRLTQVSRAEPLASLFEIPADYTIMDGPGVVSEKLKIK